MIRHRDSNDGRLLGSFRSWDGLERVIMVFTLSDMGFTAAFLDCGCRPTHAFSAGPCVLKSVRI